MTDVGTARVKVVGDTKRLEQDIERGTTRAAEGVGPKAGKSLGSSMAKGFAAAFAGAAIVAEIGKQIDAASSLSEQVSRSGKVFGDAADEVQAWSETTAEGIGQSQRAALDAASTFGVFGKSAGLAGSDLVGFSTKLTSLASDLASINDTTPEEAVQALGAALRGEAEPIRRFGVLLDDATLKQEALALGLTRTTKDALTPQQRVLAAQAAIFKQTALAQGDFADTSDGLANSQRSFTASLENARAELGEQWLPIATEATQTATGLLKRFGALPEPIQQTTLGLALLSAGSLLVVPRLAATAEAAIALRGAMAGSARLTALSAAAFGPWGVIVGGAAVLAGVFAANAKQAGGATDTWTEALTFQNNVLDANSRKLLAKKLAAEGLLDNVRELGLSESEFLDIVQNGGPPLDALLDRIVDNKTAAEQFGGSQLLAKGGLDAFTKSALLGSSAQDGLSESAKKTILRAQELNREIAGSAEVSDLAARASGENAEATADVGDAATDAKKAVDEYRQALDNLDRGFVDTRQAQAGWQEAIDAATQAIKDNGATLDLNTDAGRDNQDQLFALRDRAFDVAEAYKAGGSSVNRINAYLNKARGEFVRNAEAMGLSSTEAENLATKVGLIERDVKIKVDANTTPARTRIEALRIEIASLKALAAGVTVGSPAAARVAAEQDANRGQGGVSRQGITSYAPRPLEPTVATPSSYGLDVLPENVAAPTVNLTNRVYIGDREITSMIEQEILEHDEGLALTLAGRR